MHIWVLMIVLLMTDCTSVFFVLLLIIVVSSSCRYYYQWHVMRSLGKSVLELKISALGDWSVLICSDKWIKVDLLCHSFVSPYLIILNFSSIDSTSYIVLITKNMFHQDEFRHLKVRLKTAECIFESEQKFSVLAKLLLYK